MTPTFQRLSVGALRSVAMLFDNFTSRSPTEKNGLNLSAGVGKLRSSSQFQILGQSNGGSHDEPNAQFLAAKTLSVSTFALPPLPASSTSLHQFRPWHSDFDSSITLTRSTGVSIEAIACAAPIVTCLDRSYLAQNYEQRGFAKRMLRRYWPIGVC